MPEKVKILIIDDNEDIVMMLEAMLTMKGFDVSVMTNTADLHSNIRSFEPKLILMDMLLSGADGREVCSELKANSEFSKIQIIMISAHPTAMEECLDAGADFFLAKPFDMAKLINTVNQAVSVGIYD